MPSLWRELGRIRASFSGCTTATSIGCSGTRGAAVIHHALTAVTWPANAIVHEKIVGVQNGVQVEAEWWQETNPPYANRVIGLVGYFDTSNYQPRYLDDPQRDGSVRVRVVVYEYLPMAAPNRALLSVTAQHPTARVVAGSSSRSGK